MTIFPSVPPLPLRAIGHGVKWPVVRGPMSCSGNGKHFPHLSSADRLLSNTHSLWFMIKAGERRWPAWTVFVWAVRAVRSVRVTVHPRQTAAVLQYLGPAQRHSDEWLEITGWGYRSSIWLTFIGLHYLYFKLAWLSCCRCAGSSCFGWLLF